MGQSAGVSGLPGGAAGPTPPAIDPARVAALADERLDWRFKAVPPAAWGLTVRRYLATEPTLDQFATPLLTLDAGALAHNLRTMADWCARAGVALAPHGKTTMAPALWQAQLDAGAYGITLANLPQLRVARAFGVREVLLANSLLDPGGLAWLAAELAADPGFRFSCWVDSVAAVRLMDQALRAARAAAGPQGGAGVGVGVGAGAGDGAGGGRPVEVLVELGGPGGRTGARDLATALDVARAVAAAPTLRLAGVGGYEGALAHDATGPGLAAVQRYLERLVELHDELRGAGLFAAGRRVLVSAGGSAYFDQVAQVLAPLGAHPDTTVVLRSGAYLAHDDGFYRAVSPLVRGGGAGAAPFRAALHGWARVLSRPEPGLALLDGGKRDFPYDEGLPEPQQARAQLALPGRPLHGVVSALNDQHAFLRGSDAEVGEVVRLGLSHPCTAFDKWTLIPVLDDASAARPRVVDLVRTFF
ncbi:alanine racemase [Kitasatospora sp. NBC_01287]|uniref:alanine racemase n=1 Tax=Kitasatospora sp. NBC_01287 TaxID=2903573 RepID=UPI002259766B|nr:alanine racemase [Kitasatospora sp. NBC_01287]MCX4744872.1 alanine racemase [Kitasatospora sp. NBC_01287]